jgi:hypothetical protein
MAKRMREDPAFAAQLFEKTSDVIVRGMLEGAVAHGQIDPEGKSEHEITREFAALILQVAESGRFLFAVDHTSSLRDFGKKFEKEGLPWLASVFYAMWVEHILNDLVSVAVVRRGESDAVTKQIIRDVSVQGKFAWLLPLLGYARFSPAHAARLGKLTDYRNQFVHYKWSYTDMDTSGKADRELVEFLTQCRLSLQYLARYRDHETLAGSKTKLRRAIARNADS